MRTILYPFLLFAVLSGFLPSCANDGGKSSHPICISFKYDQPVNGYEVSGLFYPFDSLSETGQVTMFFKSLDGGKDFVYSNVDKFETDHPEYPLKFTGYNIYEQVFSDGFTGFQDGESLVFHYNTEPNETFDSPLYYNAEFQFFDVDMDGEDEFLVNDYYMGACGNHYTAYEIGMNGLKEKVCFPFNSITNLTKFDSGSRVITTPEYGEYLISEDGEMGISVN